MQSPDSIMDKLSKYRGKTVVVLFSAGMDSATLAIQLSRVGATVHLAIFDNGMANCWTDPHARLDEPEDTAYDVTQMRRYAEKLKGIIGCNILELRAPLLNSLRVNPDNLVRPTDSRAIDAEDNHGLVFYSGYVVNLLMIALSSASTVGADYVLTGHMGWNSHYLDESSYCANECSNLFSNIYSSRLVVTPKVEMPWRDIGVTKADLVVLNKTKDYFVADELHCSCRVGVYSDNGDFLVDSRGTQYHCGTCEHCLERKQAYLEAGEVDTSLYVSV